MELNPRSRLKVTLAAMIFLAASTLIALLLRMEAPATAAIAAFMTVLSTYIWGETKRPSQPPS